MVKFYVVLENNLLRVETPNDADIRDIFEELKSSSETARLIFGRRASYDQYQYYKLKNPLPLPLRVTQAAEIVQTCLDRREWEEVSPNDGLAVLSATFTPRHVYMVIQPKAGAAERAIANLRTNYAEIFSCLQITVTNLNRWSRGNVEINLNGGKLLVPGDGYPIAISSIEMSLAQHRTFIPPEMEEKKDYDIACHYPSHFKGYFVHAANPPGNVTNREFATFFNILRCFDEDSNHIKGHTSSALKASNFIVYFILPPFFSRPSTRYQFHQEEPWEFPVFLRAESEGDGWCRSFPRSDFMVSSPSSLCPFLILEVVSQKNGEDRWRMLLQAIAVARAGQHMMINDAPMQFFVVAVYLKSDLTVERYVVSHTEVEDGEEDEESEDHKKVYITQKDFNLCTADGAVAFLREMYNLAVKIEELAGYLDQGKQRALSQVKNAAKDVMSLTSKAKEKRTARSTLASIPECDGDDKVQDDLGVFSADDIQTVLRSMNYQINFILFGFPLVASVSNITDETETGYLKFVRDGGKEIQILQYLTGINSPENHTISGVRIWPVRGGNVISMPVAGAWLTSLRNPSAHLWSVAKQLFEAIDFMHRHGVAHMDLKPQNILIPRDGGRLSIIDFNRSLRVKGVRHKFRGIVGTTGYISPEVAAGDGLYSAIRADLWSCGKTLEELCDKCRPSVERDTLLDISSQLMDEDPEQRPMMSDVLDRLARCIIGITTTPPPFKAP